MENMIKNKNIKLPFCISWANEPWARNWDGKEKEVLMPQVYGGKKEWKEHFDYLSKFFLDSRYIKKDNKPVFLIYRTSSIPKCDEMIKFFDIECKKIGFSGIYVIETMNSFQNKSICKESEAVVEFEPMLTIRHYLPLITQGKRFIKKKLNILDKLDYSEVWKKVIEKDIKYSKKRFLGGFISWDNTARKGKKGMVLINSSYIEFEKYMKRQYKKAKSEKSEFIFINAWNEWAEGTYLEPDSNNRYDMLKVIKEVSLSDE